MKKNSVKEPCSLSRCSFCLVSLIFANHPLRGMEGLTTHCIHEPPLKRPFAYALPFLLPVNGSMCFRFAYLVKYHQRTFSFETPHKLRYTYQHIDAAFTRFRLMLFVIRLPNPLPFYLLEVICRSFLFSRYNRGRFR